MRYIIAGSVTYSNQANRDAAKARIDTALAGYTYTTTTTVFSPGVNLPNTTTITFSLDADGDEATARGIYQDAYSALTTTTRFTSGWLCMSRIP